MRAVLAFLCAGLALECCGGEWVAWPAGEAVPEGWSRKVDATTGGVYVDVNATVLASLESMERRWRESVDNATRKEDTTKTMSRRETMLSALGRLPADELGDVGDLASLDDAALDALWDARQAMLKSFSETLTDGAKAAGKRLGKLLDKENLAFELDELEFELGDMDAARDFHDSLGGWPVVAALLGPDTEPRARAAACRVIGTAVKNDDASQKWVLEDDVLGALVRALEDDDDPALHRAALYALGAALRGNRDTQRAFGRRGTRAVVSAANGAARAVVAARARGDGDGRAWGVADKAATLLGDLADEGLRLPPDACAAVGAVLRLAAADRRAERPLKAALASAPSCGAGWREAGGFVELAGDLGRAVAGADGLDGDLRYAIALDCDALVVAVRDAAAPPAEKEQPELLPQALVDRLIAAVGHGEPDRAEL